MVSFTGAAGDLLGVGLDVVGLAGFDRHPCHR